MIFSFQSRSKTHRFLLLRGSPSGGMKGFSKRRDSSAREEETEWIRSFEWQRFVRAGENRRKIWSIPLPGTEMRKIIRADEQRATNCSLASLHKAETRRALPFSRSRWRVARHCAMTKERVIFATGESESSLSNDRRIIVFQDLGNDWLLCCVWRGKASKSKVFQWFIARETVDFYAFRENLKTHTTRAT